MLEIRKTFVLFAFFKCIDFRVVFFILLLKSFTFYFISNVLSSNTHKTLQLQISRIVYGTNVEFR